MEFDDYEVDDIVNNLKKTKKIKSGSKGKRGERGIVDDLNNRFRQLFDKNPEWGQFSRSVGSGNRWGQRVFLPQHAKDTFSGDLTCPAQFLFTIESKSGYNEIDLYNCIVGKCKELDTFLEQASSDSERVKKKPLLIWKKDRKNRIAFLHVSELTDRPDKYLVYKDWIGVCFNWLLGQEDEFFFNLLPCP